MRTPSDTFTLLAHCARVQAGPTQLQQLAQAARQFTHWPMLPRQAENHGIAPLAHVHLKAAQVETPPDVTRQLLALYLRHRHDNQLRSRVLSDVLKTLQAAGIETVVLKGAALSHTLYPDPALRPMSDLDLLLRKDEARAAQKVLAAMSGYSARHGKGRLEDSHHITTTLSSGGAATLVELHHNVCGVELDALKKPPRPFALPDGSAAQTLSHEEMLWHLCNHMSRHSNVYQAIRLIWMTDIVGYAERYYAEIDWPWARRQFPIVGNVLSLLHWVIPLTDELIATAGLRLGRRPDGAGVDFTGWPRSSLAAQPDKGMWAILNDSLLPSPWWLRLHYGLGNTTPLFWYRWVRHPLHIVRWFYHLLSRQANKQGK